MTRKLIIYVCGVIAIFSAGFVVTDAWFKNTKRPVIFAIKPAR